MKYRKIMALVLAAVMTLAGTVQTVADEISFEESEVEEFNGTVSDNGISRLGLHGMTLDAAMIQDKKDLGKMAENLQNLEEGKDYSGESLYFVCEDEASAEEIADCYGADLEDYDYGVGIIDIEDMSDEVQDMSVTELVALAADMNNSLPALYPDLMNYTDDYGSWGERYEADLTSEAEASAGGAPVNDPMYPVQWSHTFLKDADAWNKGITGRGVKIAILDTGVRGDHEDLKDNIVGGYNAVKGIEGDYDDSVLISTYGNIGGHGTHVAGIAAAKANNGVGGAGVAPDADLLAVRVFSLFRNSDGYGLSAYDSHIVRGINYAIAKKADVINMSLGKLEYSAPMEKGVNKAVKNGIVVVCSAGNSYDDKLNFPAAYDSVISVAALSPAPFLDTGNAAEEIPFYETADEIANAETILKSYKADNGAVLACYSTTGDTVDICAPGSGYYSSYYQGTDSYTYMRGTSMASPAAAGAAALILQATPGLLENRSAKRCEIVRDIMQKSAYQDSYSSPWETVVSGTGGMVVPARNHGTAYGGLNVSEAISYSEDVIADLKAPSVDVASLESYDSKNLLSGTGKTLKLINPNSEGTIYYTTDGTKPDPNTAEKYNDATGIRLDFKGKLKLKAIVVNKDIVSPVMSYTKSFKAKADSISFAAITLKAGGKASLKVTLTPSYAEWPAVTWGNLSGYRISGKNGKYTIKAPANAEHAVITGTVAYADGTTSPVELPVYITADPIQKVSFIEGTPNELFSAGSDSNVNYLSFVSVEQPTAARELLFTSSNSDVLYITPAGQAVAKKAGKATIKVVANDGSRKSAKIKVTVKNPVYKINKIYTDTGFDTSNTGGPTAALESVPIAKGGTIKLGTVLNDYDTLGKKYKKPSNGKIEWVLGGFTSGATIDDKGVLRLPMDAVVGNTFTVTARSTDGYGDVSQTLSFSIYERAQGITVDPSRFSGSTGQNGMFGLSVNGNGYYYDDIKVKYSKTGICKVYTSVYEPYGEVTYGIQLVRKGSVKVTYYIPDGSGVKAVQYITVN